MVIKLLLDMLGIYHEQALSTPEVIVRCKLTGGGSFWSIKGTLETFYQNIDKNQSIDLLKN